ncbi:hypothetical protein TOC8172_31030 [Pseudomonas syringae]
MLHLLMVLVRLATHCAGECYVSVVRQAEKRESVVPDVAHGHRSVAQSVTNCMPT